MEEKPRLSRLTAIITQLQAKRLVTANQLAEKHGVSIRTIYRDIRTLEKSGIPITTEDGKGYSLLEGFRIPPIQFTEDEANALVTAEQIVAKSKDRSLSENYSNAVTKIRSVLKYSQIGKADLLAERIYYHESDDEEQTSQYLMKIQSAITNFKVVEIDYISVKGDQSTRTVEPFALYSTGGKWMLIAFCRLREAFRVFRIDLIQSLTTHDESFTPHEMTLQKFYETHVQKKNEPPLT